MPGQKILIFTTAKSGSGVSVFNERIAADLKTAGYAVTIAQPVDADYVHRSAFLADVSRHTFTRDPYDDIRAFAADKYLAAALFDELRPDLVLFSNGIHPVASMAGMQSALFFGIPYVIVDGLVTPHLFSGDAAAVRVLSNLYRAARAVVVKCQNNLDVLRQYLQLPLDVGQVIFSGRPPVFFEPRDDARRRELRAQWNVPEDAVLCFTAAKLEPVKGYEIQIGAMRRLMDRPAWDRLHFAWAGDGANRDGLEAALTAVGASDRVRFLGHRTDVAALLDAADCFVLTSHAEAAPLSIIEAMAKSLPVVATDIGGNGEALAGNGVLVARPGQREKSEAELAAALERLVLDTGLRKDLGAAAHAYAVQHYLLDRMMADYRAVIERSLGDPR